jgi:membrane protease YdiL (CAAX protease family)
MALFFAVLISNLALGQLFSGREANMDWLLVATPLVLLFWTGLFVYWFRVDPKETLLLRLPAWPDLLMAIPLAISFVILSDQLSSLTSDLVPEDLAEQLREVQIRWLRASGALEWMMKLGTIGVAAAISEELMFRGFVQSAFARSMKRSTAVIWTSFLFMALHILPLPSFAAAGLVLGVTALATRSVVVPVVIHFINNAAALALVNLAGLETLGDPVWIPPSILLPAVAIFVLCMTYYARRLVRVTEEGPGTSFPERPGPAPEDDRPVLLPRAGPTFAEELQSVPRGRRRLGFLVIAAAIVVGTTVLLALFASSLYMSNPQGVQATFIEALSQETQSRLDPDAMDRSEELHATFAELTAANETGSLGWRQLFRVARAYATASADGSIDSRDVDAILEAVREAVKGATSPRRL